MNRTIIVFSLFAVIFSSAYAQKSSNGKEELADQVSVLYQKGDLEKAIKAGEQLVKLEKAGGDPVSYVNSLVNLGRIKREYYASLQNKVAARQIDAREIKETLEKSNQTADDAELLFRMALELNERFGKGQTAQTADIKKDLAWIVANHTYSGKKSLGKSRDRIDEAAQLFMDAITLSEQTRGEEADETLFIVQDAGDFYYKYASFQKAVSLYERFIQTYEKKHGANHPDLVRALRSYASILYTLLLDQDSAAAIKRIEAITKKKEPMSKGEADLHLRSKDSVAYSAPIIMDVNERSEAFRNKLKAEGKTLNAGNLSSMPKIITVPVKVEVDETGRVIKAVAQTDKDKLAEEAEAVVSTWTVSPVLYKGVPTRMRGILNYRKSQ